MTRKLYLAAAVGGLTAYLSATAVEADRHHHIEVSTAPSSTVTMTPVATLLVQGASGCIRIVNL